MLNFNFIFEAPFEQFVAIPFVRIKFFFFDFIITNIDYCLFLLFLTTLIVASILLLKKFSFHAIPTVFETQILLFYLVIQSLIEKHIHVKFYQQAVFPIIFSLGTFLILVNLSGNLPIFMSLASQFTIITALFLPLFLGFFFLFFFDRNITFFRVFYTPGTDILLAIILFPIELLTFFMRPISIVCRLCSNIMSGHIVIKVCLHTIFAITFIKNSSNIFLSLTISALILPLLPILLLEFCVSLIQVYVFLVIFCMFLNDIMGHHFTH